MPAWMTVLLVVWVPVMCLLSVLLGSFITYCRDAKVNPVSQLRAGLFVPPEESARKREEETSFWS